MALGQDDNQYIPLNNNWFPKHDKALVGDFYGEISTQKTLKVPKEALTQMERPEVVMMQKAEADAARYKTPPGTPVPPANAGSNAVVAPVSYGA